MSHCHCLSFRFSRGGLGTDPVDRGDRSDVVEMLLFSISYDVVGGVEGNCVRQSERSGWVAILCEKGPSYIHTKY